LIISRDGGDIITLGGDAEASIQTVRIYPTHEKDHLFGSKHLFNDPLQCTKVLDVWEETNFELVLDDLWYPDAKYTNEDDFCSVLVHGWELEWYWYDAIEMDGDWIPDAGTNKVDIWFSRETGAADFCLSEAADECDYDITINTPALGGFCITYWVKCEPKDFSAPSTVEEDLVAEAWTSWFGW